MTANCSNAARTYEYQPTILDTKPLLTRLSIQIAFARNEFRRDPRGFATALAQDLLSNKAALLSIVFIAIALLLVIDNANGTRGWQPVDVPEPAEVVLMDIRAAPLGVGFNQGTGQGSARVRRPAHGGGGGGDQDPKPPQTGKLPPPSTIPAAIPIAARVTPAALPVAGIVLDPALWKDLKAPVYGDPRTTSEIPSKGPGQGGGIGTNRGAGTGDGNGSGVGPGFFENTGTGWGQNGCCGDGTGGGRGVAGGGGAFRSSEVDQRPRLLSKPEPQYSEEARRNQISGTVVLTAVFSSGGEVVQIRALNALPFGLTERAITAAQQIKFIPAMKDGRPVSVYMHLEYNFNLY